MEHYQPNPQPPPGPPPGPPPLQPAAPAAPAHYAAPTQPVAPSAPTATMAPPPQAPPTTAAREDVAVEVRVGRGVGQLLMMSAGIIFLILGGLALSKTGLDVTIGGSNHVVVAGLHHTALMALVELIVGLTLVVSGARPLIQWSSVRLFGAICLAFGVVLLAEPPGMHRALGAHAPTGFLFLTVGVVLLVAAVAYPMMVTDRGNYET